MNLQSRPALRKAVQFQDLEDRFVRLGINERGARMLIRAVHIEERERSRALAAEEEHVFRAQSSIDSG